MLSISYLKNLIISMDTRVSVFFKDRIGIMGICSECNKESLRGFAKGKCNTCYERTRKAALPVTDFICITCGPVRTKCLTGGKCPSCRMKHRRQTLKRPLTCQQCSKTFLHHCNTKKCNSCRKKSWIANKPDYPSAYYSSKKEWYSTYSKNWRKNNPDKNTAKSAAYMTSKSKASPKWLSKVQKDNILIFYEAAAQLSVELGVKFHVDHIMPLKGKNSCGLHVPWNLQVIPAIDNIKKSNKIKDLK